MLFRSGQAMPPLEAGEAVRVTRPSPVPAGQLGVSPAQIADGKVLAPRARSPVELVALGVDPAEAAEAVEAVEPTVAAGRVGAAVTGGMAAVAVGAEPWDGAMAPTSAMAIAAKASARKMVREAGGARVRGFLPHGPGVRARPRVPRLLRRGRAQGTYNSNRR